MGRLLLLAALLFLPRPLQAQTSGAFVQAHRSALVIVKDESGAGSGFIASFAGKVYLLTNAHVLAGTKRPVFTLLDGTKLVPTSLECAVGHDIVRLALKDVPPDAIEAGTEIEKSARLDDEVFVFGNSGGGGVVTALPGRIVGLGPDRIEVSSPFIPGNSGSPIIHAASGKVIGIATYLTRDRDEFGSGRGGGGVVTRRFGYRLDSVKTWEPVNFTVFTAEAEKLGKVEALSDDLVQFLGALQRNKEPALATDTLRRPAMEWHQKVSNRKVSEADKRSATQSFLGSLRSMSRADISPLEKSLHYDFFRRELAKQRELRDQLYEGFNKSAQEMASPSIR